MCLLRGTSSKNVIQANPSLSYRGDPGLITGQSVWDLCWTKWQIFLWVLQFSLFSIIPPLLHTHSFIYHTHCIMFLSQYFSFPLSVSFHHCSIFIHLPHTLYNVPLPVLQFSPVSIIPPLLHTHLFIYMLILREGARDEAWELSKKQCSFENRRGLTEKEFIF